MREEKNITSKRKNVDVWRYKKYECRVKIVDISTGRKLIILNKDEAREHDIYLGRRSIIKCCGGKKHAVIVDVSETAVKPGEVGMFKDTAEYLGLTGGEKVEIIHMNRPESVQHIKDKLDGKVLSPKEIDTVISDLMRNRLSDVELSAWICGVYINGLQNSEIVGLTNSIVNSGERLKLGVKTVCDKHSIGGVAGNRTTMVIVPIIAAAGLHMPKSSSRAITSAAGTADVMEMLAPVDLDMNELKKVVLKAKGAIVWGGGLNLASADDHLIKVRNPLRLDPKGMLLSSILAKKKAVGATHVIIDIPVGRGAKIEDLSKAKLLGKHFIDIGEKGLGMDVEALVTDGSEPIGSGVGVALEARDVLQVLEGEGPGDLRHKSCLLAGKLLELSGKVSSGKGYDVADSLIRNGKALKKFKQIIDLQGGDSKVTSNSLKIGKHKLDVKAKMSGKIHHIDSKTISKLARLAGAPKDHGSGVYIHVSKGQKVKKGDTILTIYSESNSKLGFVKKALKDLEPIEMRKFILGVLD